MHLLFEAALLKFTSDMTSLKGSTSAVIAIKGSRVEWDSAEGNPLRMLCHVSISSYFILRLVSMGRDSLTAFSCRPGELFLSSIIVRTEVATVI
jgi:hypothetical protein